MWRLNHQTGKVRPHRSSDSVTFIFGVTCCCSSYKVNHGTYFSLLTVHIYLKLYGPWEWKWGGEREGTCSPVNWLSRIRSSALLNPVFISQRFHGFMKFAASTKCRQGVSLIVFSSATRETSDLSSSPADNAYLYWYVYREKQNKSSDCWNQETRRWTWNFQVFCVEREMRNG